MTEGVSFTIMTNINSSEEAAAIAFFSFKRVDGFEVSLTLRGDTGANVLKNIETAIKFVKQEGGIPCPKYSKFDAKPAPKQIIYVENADCPLCHKRVVKFETSTGKTGERCETNKYNFQTKQVEGCKYVMWDDTYKPMKIINDETPPDPVDEF